ncbi:hypothetical protein [Rhodococcus sp. NPDC058514]|uniref:hypothetical protein n=1 Tax=unclassified Rhodococcus (in: high G+C Gram-positive bacteria) TaxID=192944 RepID=UPI003664BA19
MGTLIDAAFGEQPGLAPLPAAADQQQHWLRAVALGGQGRYAAARTELSRIGSRRFARGEGRPASRDIASLALSTEASLLRQLGWHRLAAGFDGRALAILGGQAGRDELPTAIAAARCDALTGLAADALGCGRLALGTALLERCAPLVGNDPGLWRQRIRLNWVSAEIALASGNAELARRHASTAVELALAADSVRHRVKSDLLLAAAHSAGPNPSSAVDLGEQVLDRCAEHGLLPLRWAAAMLVNGVRPTAEAAAIRDDCRRQITDRGGRFREL